MRKRIGWTNLENEIGKKQEGRNAWKREKCMKKINKKDIERLDEHKTWKRTR